MSDDTAERWDYIQELIGEALPNKSAEQKRKYIARVDKPEKSMHYWYVNVDIKEERYRKTFCDKKNGGKTSALLAAVGYRDKLLKELGIVILKGHDKQPYDPDKKGVYYKEKSSNGYTYPYMLAYWQEPVKGKQIRKYKAFSINKYGYNKAKGLAIKFRKNKLKELYG